MKKKQNLSMDAATLRQRAEAQYDQNHAAEDADPQSNVDLQRLVYELQVHQIELEMQNEELVQTREALEKALRQYTDLYDFSPLGYFTLDREGTILQANLSGASLLGVERARLTNRRLEHFISVETRSALRTFLRKNFENSPVETCEVTLHGEGNEVLYLNIDARLSENGQECYAVAVDITAHKLLEMETRYLISHDSLTGLYNRGYFQETMDRLEHSRQFPISILMADVDQLKKMNDQNGHSAGDAILKKVAEVLTTAFRTEDIIARIGGDEFAVILPNTDALAARNAVRRLSAVLNEHNATQAGLPVRLSFAASTAETSKPLTDVLKEADEKMYLKKGHHHGS